MKIVTCMGGLYKMTDLKFRKYLEAVYTDQNPDISDYATYVGPVVNVSDISRHEAFQLLMGLTAKRRLE